MKRPSVFLWPTDFLRKLAYDHSSSVSPHNIAQSPEA